MLPCTILILSDSNDKHVTSILETGKKQVITFHMLLFTFCIKIKMNGRCKRVYKCQRCYYYGNLYFLNPKMIKRSRKRFLFHYSAREAPWKCSQKAKILEIFFIKTSEPNIWSEDLRRKSNTYDTIVKT